MTSWNRAQDGSPDETDGWGYGPGGRPHLRHWAEGVTIEGETPPRCWCWAPATQPVADPQPRRRTRVAKDTPPPAPEAVEQGYTASELDDATATRLLITWLKREVARR